MSERKIRRGGANGSIVAAPLNTTATTPPIVHAISGSFASALALLLFYPLERARIEMQTAVAASGSGDNDQQQGQKEQQQSKSMEAGTHNNDNDDNGLGVPSSSWSMASSSSPSSSSSSIKNQKATPLDFSDDNAREQQQQPTREKRQKLVACLLDLFERGDIYRGVTPVCLTMAISNFVFFYAHNAVKRFLQSSSTPSSSSLMNKNNKKQHRYGSGSIVVVEEEKPSMTMSLIASSLAGIINVLITNPLWVSNIRIVQGCSNSNEDESESEKLKTQLSPKPKSSLLLFQEMIRIGQKEGLASLWNGTGASLLLVSNPVIQFFMYEQLKVLRLSGFTASMLPRLTPLEAFFIGALAKAAATVITYPLQLAQVLLRVKHKKQQEKAGSSSNTDNHETTTDEIENNNDNNDGNDEAMLYNGTLDCFQKLYSNGGLQALYAGMNAKLLQTVLTAATTFLSYEQILRVVRVSHVVLQQQRQRTR